MRLIDADKLMSDLILDCEHDEHRWTSYDCILDMVEDQPTVSLYTALKQRKNPDDK